MTRKMPELPLKKVLRTDDPGNGCTNFQQSLFFKQINCTF